MRYRSVTLYQALGKSLGSKRKSGPCFVLQGVDEFQVKFRNIRIWDLLFSKVSCFSQGKGAGIYFMNSPFCLLSEWLQWEEMRLILILGLVWRLRHSFGKERFKLLGAEEGSRNQLSHFTGHFSHVCPWASSFHPNQPSCSSPQVLTVLLLSTQGQAGKPLHPSTSLLRCFLYLLYLILPLSSWGCSPLICRCRKDPGLGHILFEFWAVLGGHSSPCALFALGELRTTVVWIAAAAGPGLWCQDTEVMPWLQLGCSGEGWE